MHVAIFVNVREGQLYKPLRVGEGARYKNGFHLDSVLPCFHWNSLWYVVFFSQVCTWLLHTCLDLYENMNISTHTHTHTHTHTCLFFGLRGLSIGVMVLYCTICMCYCPTPTLHLNLALTGDCVHFKIFKKNTISMFLSLLNYGDIGSVLIKHLQIVIPLSYPCY